MIILWKINVHILMYSVIFTAALIYFESTEEDDVAGFFVFSHIQIRGYFRLG